MGMRCDHSEHAGGPPAVAPSAVTIVRFWLGQTAVDLAMCEPHDKLLVADAISARMPYARMVLPLTPETA